MVYPIQRLIVPPLLKLIWIKEIKGVENIPSDGRFIATPNHQSYFDDWLMPTVVVWRLNKKLHMYVTRKFYKNFLSRLYLNHCECIPVETGDAPDKKKVNEDAFNQGRDYLARGEPMCIYPEGTRSKDGKLQQGKFGAAKLAIAEKVPILPIGISGTREVLPKGKSLPRLRKVIKINIGKPVFLDNFYGKEDKQSLKEATDYIMKEIEKAMN